MGMSQCADLAWGINLGDDDERNYEVAEAIDKLTEHDYDLEDLFGFTEPHPWNSPEFPNWSELSREERQPILDAFNERKEAATPVEFDHYGHCDYSIDCLIIKRGHQHAYWGLETVDPAALAPPTEAEVAALNRVLDAIGYTGDRTPKLLLFASYG